MWDIFNIWGKNLKTNIDELKWIRIFDPVHIPVYLVEQIKERSFPVERFYQYQRMVCVQEDEGKMVLNPMNLLYVLANKEKLVKGFLWAVIDPLSNHLVINTFSMDKEYWGEGRSVALLERKVKEIQEGAKLDRVYWITRCPKHSEKYGFKRSKHTLMEYIGYGRDTDGESIEAGGSSSIDDSGATKVPTNDAEGDWSGFDASRARAA